VTETFSPKLVAPDEGKTVMLFGVRFSYKVVSADSGGSLAVLEVEIPPATRAFTVLRPIPESARVRTCCGTSLLYFHRP
jgi:hypothetical protein